MINHELKLLSNWLRLLNKLSLNADKTELIYFRSNKRHLNLREIYVKLDGTRLTPANYVKYLGMYLDKHLSWDLHIQNLSKKLSRANGIISKLRHNAPRKVCLQVYYSIFYSHMMYGCNLWGLTSLKNLSKIEVLQRKCVRIIMFSDFDTPTNPLFIELKILKVSDLIKLQQLKLVYEYYNSLLPLDICQYFTPITDIHYNLRSANNNCLFIDQIKTSYAGIKSLKYRSAILWNHFMANNILLDNNIKFELNKVHNVYQFKRLIKKHFQFTYTLH